jgi:hypothetical protein
MKKPARGPGEQDAFLHIRFRNSFGIGWARIVHGKEGIANYAKKDILLVEHVNRYGQVTKRERP